MNGVMSRMRPEETSRSRTTGGAENTIALLPIGADLLPRQAAARRGGRGRRLVALGVVLAAVVAVAGAWLFAAGAKSGADGDLAAAQDRQRSLQTQQQRYADVVGARQQAQGLRDTLAQVMATDTPWSTLLAAVGGVRGGVTFTGVDGSLDDPTAASAEGTATGAVATPGAIGTVTIEGTAADKPTIAAFVEALGTLDGLADPFLSSVAAQSGAATAGGAYSFTVTVALTADLRSAADSRWATTTGGGK